MHALPVAYVGVQLAEYEKDIQENSLRIWFAEIRVLWHATDDILEDLAAELLILA